MGREEIMSLSEIAVPTFVRLLGSLSGFLDKAAAHAEAKKSILRCCSDAALPRHAAASIRTATIGAERRLSRLTASLGCDSPTRRRHGRPRFRNVRGRRSLVRA